MASSLDYLRGVQKFTTSQYWSTGVRITAGVMVPTLVMAQQGWLINGMPFLWGSLFVSMTDTPGPIQHRRNGMLAAIALNTFSVLLTGVCRDYQLLLLAEIIIFTFSFSLFGVYGSRAGAVGTLALVIMLLNIVPRVEHQNVLLDAAILAGGGLWYTCFSLLLYRLRPYRLAAQAIGECLIDIAAYVRARASLYKPGGDLHDAFHRVMQAQVAVQQSETQTRELLFKTRQFVVDASPKSRSMMMIFLDAVDLFEHTVSSYQNYQALHDNLKSTGLLAGFYSVILQLAAETEYIGLKIQSGLAVRRDIDMTSSLADLEISLEREIARNAGDIKKSLHALQGTLSDIRTLANRLQRIVLFSRLEIDTGLTRSRVIEASKMALRQPLEWATFAENLTFQSDTFRYAIRLTLSMVVGFSVSVFFSLSHTYWVLLTILTILRPVYTVTKKRNIQRLSGTFVGAFLGIVMLSFVTNTITLVIAMTLCMLLAYSFLRVNYFSFVLFLTLFIIITFHFLDPVEIEQLIIERLFDTAIGSAIAAVAARFIFPVWEHHQMEKSVVEMLIANRAYFSATWQALREGGNTGPELVAARKKAIVTLANLSDRFQKILTEPQGGRKVTHLHQMVIASHMLTGHISALFTSLAPLAPAGISADENLVQAITDELSRAEEIMRKPPAGSVGAVQQKVHPQVAQTLNPLSIIYSLTSDTRTIVQKMMSV